MFQYGTCIMPWGSALCAMFCGVWGLQAPVSWEPDPPMRMLQHMAECLTRWNMRVVRGGRKNSCSYKDLLLVVACSR
jgi:hypothetical protein